CLEERPPLVAADSPGHFYRCFFPIGTPESEEALARNLAAGTPVGVPAPRTTTPTEES
ncbi:MAG: ABC transporter ATP-binding protein, partial [Actinobacteria bacterium]|nr:ABC transporter ATP-binding protein [Actinomycetota bacterium]